MTIDVCGTDKAMKLQPPELLYLELMKKALTFSLWDEPGIPVEMFNNYRALPKRILIRALSRGLGLLKYRAVRPIKHLRADRINGHVWPMYADTMLGIPGLDNIQRCVEKILRDNVPGDLIETGVWRGGGSIFMRAVLAAYGVTNRRVFVADSFEGLPSPDITNYPQDEGDPHHTLTFLAVPQEEVEANFRKYGLLDAQVVFLRGWFKDTLPSAPIDKLAILRLDGDMYESTIIALESLYPKLSEGGLCIVDDYELPGCKQAVDDYRKRYEIKSPFIKDGWVGVFWQK
jgi:O-methyltransferase